MLLCNTDFTAQLANYGLPSNSVRKVTNIDMLRGYPNISRIFGSLAFILLAVLFSKPAYAEGFDQNVIHFRIAPIGNMISADDTQTHISIRYKMRVY